MTIRKMDLLHGAALVPIVTHPSFTTLNKASDHYGDYRINGDRRLFVKYVTATRPPWKFSFSADELSRLRSAPSANEDVVHVLALVCGTRSVCALYLDEVFELVAADRNEAQAITVMLPPGSSMRVAGPIGKLKRTVAHSRFPAIVMDV